MLLGLFILTAILLYLYMRERRLRIELQQECSAQDSPDDSSATTVSAPIVVGNPIVPKQDDSDGEKPRILVVEDNHDLLTYICSLIDDRYAVSTAVDGRVGLAKAKELVPDIILTDIMMPEMDGVTMIQELRGRVETSHIPVIILTAKADPNDKIMGIKKGADAFLVKPFDEEELLVRIETMLTNRAKAQRYFAKTYRLDDATKETEDSFILLVQSCISERIADVGFGVQDICDAVHLERTQVYRKIKALTGLTPTTLIRKMRMEHAWRLLQEGQMQISEVAYACGFKEPSYFTKVFKEYFDQKPSDVLDQLD